MTTGDADQNATGGQTDTGNGSPAQDDNNNTTATTEEKTFSQAEVDKIVEDRLKRDRKKAQDAAEKARISQLSEHEQAIELAKAEARAEVKRDNATTLAAAEIRVALSDFVDNPEDIIADLDLSRYVDEDFSVNSEAVKKLRTKYESLLGGVQKRRGANTFQPGRSNSSRAETPEEAFARSMNDLFK